MSPSDTFSVSGSGVADGFESNGVEMDFSETVHIDGPVEASIQTTLPYSSEPHISTVAAFVTFSGDIPDDRAAWHRNYTRIESWMAVHVLREANGWSIQKTANRLKKERNMPQMLGFFEEGPVKGDPGDPPSYTQLRDMWEEEFTDRHRGAVKVIAERLVQYCRENGIPAPEGVFEPDEDIEPEEIDEDDPTIRDLTTDKTIEIWKTAKPIVLNHWYLKRRHNWQVPEHVFADAQAHMATGKDLFPETGVGNLTIKGKYDDVHYPSTHRRELKKFDIDEIRDLYHAIVKELVEKARSEGELVGNLKAAIDITYGHPWTGEIERNEDGDNIEPWIQGYKNDNDERTQYYFKWASIQIVGLDIPLVLDAMPVKRGKTRGDLVDDLLENALQLVEPAVEMRDDLTTRVSAVRLDVEIRPCGFGRTQPPDAGVRIEMVEDASWVFADLLAVLGVARMLTATRGGSPRHPRSTSRSQRGHSKTRL